MSVVYRATDEPVATREDYWRHVLDETVVPMEVRFDDGPELRDELVTSDLGPMRVTESPLGQAWSSGRRGTSAGRIPSSTSSSYKRKAPSSASKATGGPNSAPVTWH